MLQKRDAAECFHGVCSEVNSDNDSNKETSFGAATYEWVILFIYFLIHFHPFSNYRQLSRAVNLLSPPPTLSSSYIFLLLIFLVLSAEEQ